MSKSIITNSRSCFVCKTPFDLHKHHIFYGTSNRKLSEKYGCWVYLCGKHHDMSDYGVHNDRVLDIQLKQIAQRAWEQEHGTTEDFIKVFGRNYLD